MLNIDECAVGNRQNKGLLARLVALPEDEAEALIESKVRGLQWFLLIAAAFHAWVSRFPASTPLFDTYQSGHCIALTVCALIGASTRWTRSCLAVAWCLVLVRNITAFPTAANHSFVELLLFSLAILCRSDRRAEQVLLLNGARWLIIIVMFFSGLQKLYHGGYFDGRFLAYMTAASERPSVSTWVLSPEALAHLKNLGGNVGTGPYAVREPLFSIMSNAVYIAEMLIGVMLLIPIGRSITVVVAIVMVLVIETTSRECAFTSMAVYLLLLFWPSDAGRRLLPVFIFRFIVFLLLEFRYPEEWIN